MDRVSESLLNEFCRDHGIEALSEETRFECFAAYIATQRHYLPSFEPLSIVVGSGGDTGIDSVAIIVNDVLITDIEQLEDEIAQSTSIDVTFVFVQAERAQDLMAKRWETSGSGFKISSRKLPACPGTSALARRRQFQTPYSRSAASFDTGIPPAIFTM